MKRVLIYPICFVSTCAIASTTFYYETGGQCPAGTGLFLNPNATSCTQAISKITPPQSSQSGGFLGYWANGTKVIDKDGNILITGQTAANLFDNSDSDDRNATAVYGGDSQVAVLADTKWSAQNYYQNWYVCPSVSTLHCNVNQNLYFWPAPGVGGNCWTFGTNPHNTGYDYTFNSWMDAGGHPHAASTRPSWHDCTVPSQNSSCNGSNVSTGDSSVSGGCKDTYLGSGAVSNGISERKIYPFACKLFHGTRSGTWVDSVNVTNGQIVLDNSTPGTCKYELQCNKDYKAGDSGTSTVSCSGTTCKTLNFNGNATSLITATCVEIPLSCPQLTPPSGVTATFILSNGTECGYQVRCSNPNYTLNGGGSTLTCLPSNCQNQLNNYSCMAPTCPTAPDVPGGHGSVPTPAPDSDGNCHYTLNCDTGYAMPDDNNPNPSFECSFNSCNGLTGWVSGLQCKKKISCPNATISHGVLTIEQANNETECRYTVQCHAPAYVCKNTSYCNDAFVCNSTDSCNVYAGLVPGLNLCEFECPSVAYVKSKIKGLQYIGFRTDLGPEKQCYYSFPSCGGCYQLASDSANSIYCNDTDDEQCNNNTWYNGIHCEYVGGDGCLSM